MRKQTENLVSHTYFYYLYPKSNRFTTWYRMDDTYSYFSVIRELKKER